MGSNAIFVVTDYVSSVHRALGDEDLKKKAQDLGKTIKPYAGDLEEGQCINAAKAASCPEVLSILEKYVFSIGCSLIPDDIFKSLSKFLSFIKS